MCKNAIENSCLEIYEDCLIRMFGYKYLAQNSTSSEVRDQTI